MQLYCTTNTLIGEILSKEKVHLIGPIYTVSRYSDTEE